MRVAVPVMLIMVLLEMMKPVFLDWMKGSFLVKLKLVYLGMQRASAQVKMIESVPEILIIPLLESLKAVALDK